MTAIATFAGWLLLTGMVLAVLYAEGEREMEQTQ